MPRVGTRIDAGLELGLYTPYITFGYAAIKNSYHFQTSPVYGFGFLKRIAKHWLWVNEINVQNVHYQNLNYNIVNFSTGLTYGF